MYRLLRIVAVCLVFMLIYPATNAFSADRTATFTLFPFTGLYTFSGQQYLKDKPVFGISLGYNFSRNWASEVSLSRIMTQEDGMGSADVDISQGRVDFLYHFLPQETLVPFLSVGVGGARITPDGLGSDNDLLLVYGAGVKYYLNDQIALRLDARHLLDINDKDVQRDDDLVHNLSIVAGLSFQFGGSAQVDAGRLSAKDSDYDGVVDTLDLCPVTPHGTPVDSSGCPSSVKFIDSDGDGVSDMFDDCPDSSASADVDANGCSSGPEVDSDKDGVSDSLDRCPVTPPGTPVDSKGCPASVKFIDSDGDGVSDMFDDCPGTLKSVKVNAKGCPVVSK